MILRDIVDKYKIRKTDLFEKISDYMIDNVSSQLSSRNIENVLKNKKDKTTHTTISNYLKYLCDSYAFYKIRRYDLKGKQYLSTNEKYYLADYSFRYALHGTRNPDYSKAMENIVAIELLRRGYEVAESFNKTQSKNIQCQMLKAKRKLHDIDENPGTGTYDIKGKFGNEGTKNEFSKQKKE